MPRNEGGKGGEGGEYPFTTFSAFGSRGLKKTQSIYAGSSLVHAGAGPEPPLRPRDLPPRGRLQVRDDNPMPPHPSRLRRIARWGRLPLIFFLLLLDDPDAREPRPAPTATKHAPPLQSPPDLPPLGGFRLRVARAWGCEGLQRLALVGTQRPDAVSPYLTPRDPCPVWFATGILRNFR